MDQPITKTSVSLGPQERRIVKSLAKNKGLNFSSALRMIIREWEEKNQAERKINKTP